MNWKKVFFNKEYLFKTDGSVKNWNFLKTEFALQDKDQFDDYHTRKAKFKRIIFIANFCSRSSYHFTEIF